MKKSNSKLQRNIYTILSTIFLVLFRAIKLIPNFTPLGSYGFMSGNLLTFFSSIILFDVLIGGTYRGMVFTYLGFLMYWILGRVAKTDKQKLFFLPVSSFLFFLISNFGVWWYWYDHSLNNLVTCYLLAVPFYRNMLLSDLFFGYGYLWIKELITNKARSTKLSFA